MIDQDELYSGLQYYQNHEYLQALKHFSRGSNKQNNQITQMIYESLEAVTNMQLCNYNRAAQQFNDLRTRLQNWQMHPSEANRTPQIQLLKVKVLANLLIIYLVNCSNEVDEVLQSLISIVQDRYDRNKIAGAALFRALLKSLFGFQTFNQVQNQLITVASRTERIQDQRFKSNRDGNMMPSPIFLSSLAIYSHLTGNIKDAIKLEKISYEMTKADNPIAAIISLRHLQELERATGNDRQRRSYHQELIVLMGNDELQGIAEETLFRNYSLKIQNAQKIIERLVEVEKQLILQPHQDIPRRAVLWKLESMKTSNDSQKLNTVIELIKKDASVLNIMTQEQFVSEAVEQYRNFQYQLVIGIKRYFFKKFIVNLNQYAFSSTKKQRKSRELEINIIKPKQSSPKLDEFQEELKQITPDRSKKSNLLSDIRLPQKNISTFRSENDNFRQSSNSPSPIHSSRLEVKPAAASKVGRNQIYMNEEKPKYKIGKDEVKKGPKTEKARQIKEKQKKMIEPKQHQQSDTFDKNPMNQFIREVIPVKQIVPEPPISLPVREKKKQQRQQEIEESETYKIPILNQDNKNSKIPKPVNPQKNASQMVKIQSSQLNSQIPFGSKIQSSELVSNVPIGIKIPSSQFNSNNPLGSGRSLVQKSSLYKENYQQRLQSKLRKCINLCISGQYIEKRHFSSDGGAQRFLKLGHHKDKLYWGQDEDHFDQSSYNIQDIKGIVFGKVTQTMLKDSNRKLEPWKCFSLIMKKRTFDVYCPEEKDLKFWIPGLSMLLKELKYDNGKYFIKSTNKKVQKHPHKSVVLGQNIIPRYYSVGRILWKKFLMRLQWQYLHMKKKDKRNVYSNANAYAIVVAAVKVLKYLPTKIKRNIQ